MFENQRGFLTFNFKSVYSAAVLRADKNKLEHLK